MAREYEIARSSGTCRACNRELTSGEEFVAALFDAGETFRRDDFCLACWQAGPPAAAGAFSTWHGRIPPPQGQPRKTFVDNQVLVEFFERLADADEPVKVNFRFVLALVLMRKKLLLYDGLGADGQGREIWRMHYRPPRAAAKKGKAKAAPAAAEGTEAEASPTEVVAGEGDSAGAGALPGSAVEVIHPKLDDDQIAVVTAQLGAIFETPP